MAQRRPNRTDVRRRYRMFRVGMDLTQMAVAELAQISRDRYWRIENGYDMPTDAERKRLAKAFKIQPEELVVAA